MNADRRLQGSCSICKRTHNVVRLYNYAIIKPVESFNFKTRVMTRTNGLHIIVCGTDMNLINKVFKEMNVNRLRDRDKIQEVIDTSRVYRRLNPINSYLSSNDVSRD